MGTRPGPALRRARPRIAPPGANGTRTIPRNLGRGGS